MPLMSDEELAKRPEPTTADVLPNHVARYLDMVALSDRTPCKVIGQTGMLRDRPGFEVDFITRGSAGATPHMHDRPSVLMPVTGHWRVEWDGGAATLAPGDTMSVPEALAHSAARRCRAKRRSIISSPPMTRRGDMAGMNRSDDIGGGLRGMQALCLPGPSAVLADHACISRPAARNARPSTRPSPRPGWTGTGRSLCRRLLARSGGADAHRAEAARRGETVDVAALHARKGALFRARLAEGVALRPGVAETLEQARRADWRSALVTTTSRDNVDAILAATGLPRAAFDVIVWTAPT